jgi:hypothetical protein
MLGISQQLHLKQNPDVQIVKDDGKGRGMSTTTSVSPATRAPNPAETTTASATVPAAEPSPKGKGAAYGWRSKLVKQLGVNYRWSDIVIDERDITRQGPNGESARLTAYGVEGANPTDVRAGDRAPDAPIADWSHGGRMTALFRLFDPSKHTALVFAPSSANASSSSIAEVIEVLTAFSANINTFIIARSIDENLPAGTGAGILVDADGDARAAYGVGKTPEAALRPTIVIVRPDSVVGAFVFAVEGVNLYFEKVFSRELQMQTRNQ